jgi:hypothetical protein
MGDPVDVRSYRVLMSKQDWGSLMANLVLYGLRRKHLSRDLAEQIAAETISRVIDPNRSPWRPDEHGTLANHLEWTFRSELRNFRDKRQRSQTSSFGDDLPEPPPDSDDNPDVRVERHGTLASLREKLFAAMAKRPLCLTLLALEEDEQVSEVDEQVARTGATRPQIYEARKVLAETARTLLADADHHLSRERSALARRSAAANDEKKSVPE